MLPGMALWQSLLASALGKLDIHGYPPDKHNLVRCHGLHKRGFGLSRFVLWCTTRPGPGTKVGWQLLFVGGVSRLGDASDQHCQTHRSEIDIAGVSENRLL